MAKQFVKITFPVNGQDSCDMLIAMLAEAGYDGFEESDDSLLAYIDAALFSPEATDEIAAQAGLRYTSETIADQNWNALWESNFPPVIVDGLCTIRAHFHDIEVTTPYDIQITPKMSFGTGHHATTQLVMRMMSETEIAGKTVLDFGTGTGVLAILAEMLGASEIEAIDNDDWCVENAIENVVRNNCERIIVKKGSLEEAGKEPVDVILANINRHILLHYMEDLFEKLCHGGTILMSGLLIEDRQVIEESAGKAGFVQKGYREQGNWIALAFGKI